MAKHLHLVMDLEEGEITGLALPKDVAGGGSSLDDYRTNIDLIGVKNGVNTVFTTPDLFVRTPFEECVRRNGVGQEEGATEDYVASESGGVGTGYDTITVAVAPLSWEKLAIDYLKQ